MSAGYDVLLGIDNDAKALETFRHNHKNAGILHGDIKAVTAAEINAAVGGVEIDVITGGVPCQSVSLSGHRDADDPRNKLFLSYIKILSELKPKAFVLENVPGLIGLFGGRLKDLLLENFDKLGYKTEFKILNADAFGVPQSRKRVFFVGLLDSEKGFEFPQSGTSKNVTCKDALSDLPEHEIRDGVRHKPKSLTEYQKLMRKGADGIFNHQTTNHTPKTVEIISLVPDGGNYKNLPEELRSTRKVNIAWTRLHSGKPSFTIDTGHRHHFHYSYNRIPTVRESARIQSFNDSFIFLGNKTSQYRQVGNAVPPFLARAVAKKLLEYV